MIFILMIQSLNKVIKNLILPQYPWIRTFDIEVISTGGLEVVNVHYYPHTDEESISLTKEHHRQVEGETFGLFKMLNLDPEYYLNSVWFLDKDYHRVSD